MIDIESSQDKMISKYISAITKILDDPQEYKQQSNKALERYKEYEREIYQKSAYYDDKFLCENRARP
jgi:TfoX/Sxy family transcriptional regulator of competence genes